MKHGGKREGSGRPKQFHEPRVQARIPVRLMDAFKEWLDKQQSKCKGDDHERR